MRNLYIAVNWHFCQLYGVSPAMFMMFLTRW